MHLDEALAPGTSVMPVVHIEDMGNTSFDYPKGESPAIVDGRVVVLTIELN